MTFTGLATPAMAGVESNSLHRLSARAHSLRRRRHIKLGLVTASFLAVSALLAPNALAHHGSTNSGQIMRWPTDHRGIAIVNQAGPEYADYLGHTVNKWRGAVAPHATADFPQGPVALRYEYGGPPRCGSPGPSEIVVCARIPASLDDPNAVGLAETLTDPQGYIRGATVYFDPRYRNDTLMSILCHEVGHALGLSHRSGNTSCMRTPAGPTEPDGHDGAQIAESHRYY